ncbi:hypothetical protein GCM10023116_50630 [Kistimonas scapharcae]|uniref:Uncharacterized protein n=1 Tax=Kistimonas scapharcae TaxID=1036133 RepID=A0ABP8V9Z7_9GAMM
MKALFIGLFFLLSGFSGVVLAEAMFDIQIETEGDLVKGDKGLLKLAITNRSVEAADIVLRITQTDGQVLLDKQSCPLVRPKQTCRATIAVTPANAGDQRFIVEALGFDAKYLCGKTVRLFTVYDTERFKSVYLSGQKSEFARAWALVHGLGNTEDAALYINRHDGEPLIEERDGRTVMLSQSLSDADDLSQQVNAVLARELEGFSGKIHLYIQSSMVADAHQVVIDSVLAARLASVTVFPVDVSMLHYDAVHIQKVAAFAGDLYVKGTETVKVMLWDTIDQNALMTGALSQLGRLRDHGIVFDNFSFLNKGYNIAALGVKDLLLSGGLYAQLIPESAMSDGVFNASTKYKADKNNLLFLGYHGYSDPYSDAWYEFLPKKQIDVLQSLNSKYDASQYNPIYQSAPDDVEIQAWLSANGTISYFKPSFPLVLWIALNEGAVTYQHNHQQHTVYFPTLPIRILSSDNDLLYNLNVDQIDAILGYSPVDSQEYEQDFMAYTTFLQMVGRTPEHIPFFQFSQWITGGQDESIDLINEVDTESVSIPSEPDSLEVEASDSDAHLEVAGSENLSVDEMHEVIADVGQDLELSSGLVVVEGEEEKTDKSVITTDEASTAEQEQESALEYAVVSGDEAIPEEGIIAADQVSISDQDQEPLHQETANIDVEKFVESVIVDESVAAQLKPDDEGMPDNEQIKSPLEPQEMADENAIVDEKISDNYSQVNEAQPGSSLGGPLTGNAAIVPADESAVTSDKPLYYMDNLVAGFSQEAFAVQASGGKVTLCVKEQPECIDGMVQGCQLILLFACCDGVCLCPDAGKDAVQQPCLWSMPLVLQTTKP